MAEDEEGPEHGALGDPVDRPEEPGVEGDGGGEEGGDGGEVPGDVGEGAPGALDPAMWGDGGADVGDFERRRSGGVELVGGALTDPLELLLTVEHLLLLATLGEPGTGRHGHSLSLSL